jgi:hypothetical protein
VESSPDLVKITPWTAKAGCQCKLSIEIPKASLAGVTPTGDTHLCCGKTLKVVVLHFAEGHTIKFDDLFGQLMKSATSKGHKKPGESALLGNQLGDWLQRIGRSDEQSSRRQFPRPRSRRIQGGPTPTPSPDFWHELGCELWWIACLHSCDQEDFGETCRCLCDLNNAEGAIWNS